jgi:anion-transporting  ArsA/GET3 family ATPase
VSSSTWSSTGSALGADVPEFVRNRVAMQHEHVQTIGEKFDGTVRAVVPLFDPEVRGLAMLRRAGEALFGETGSSA